MKSCEIKIQKLDIVKNVLGICATIALESSADSISPKIHAVFEYKSKSRIIPFIVTDCSKCDNKFYIECEYDFLLDHLFYKTDISGSLEISFFISVGDVDYAPIKITAVESNEASYSDDKITINSLSVKYNNSMPEKSRAKNFVVFIINLIYRYYCRKKISKNRVCFMSSRRNELSGNCKFVYDMLRDNENIQFEFLLFSNAVDNYRISNVLKFLRLYATSGVVVVDDYFRMLNYVDKRDGVKLFQLWHACGAFKTFGYSSLSKPYGPLQSDTAHRMYDYAVVSGEGVAKHYQEGFGLSSENVVAAGVARTDAFFDEEHKRKAREDFFEKQPAMKDKKIILFAPTFRGSGQVRAGYDLSKLDPQHLCDVLGEDYAVILKLHPFCQQRYVIDEKYANRIIDMSDSSELNDLLFVTDLLVTDYSSVIFEASLLDIPMLFFAYDLEEYIAQRDFYYEYKQFVPGKIVSEQGELEQAILQKDFCPDAVKIFKNRFLDKADGHATQRVCNLILSQLGEDYENPKHRK